VIVIFGILDGENEQEETKSTASSDPKEEKVRCSTKNAWGGGKKTPKACPARHATYTWRKNRSEKGIGRIG